MDNSQTLNFLQVDRTHEELSGGEAFGRMLGGLAICLVLILVGVAVLKRVNRYVGGPSDKRLKVKERLPLSNKTSLVLVDLGGREILLSVGSEAVTELRGTALDNQASRDVTSPTPVLSEADKGKVARALTPSKIEIDGSPQNDNTSLSIEHGAYSQADDDAGDSDIGLPIFLNRPVLDSLDQSLIESKVLADQLIITNPYRQQRVSN